MVIAGVLLEKAEKLLNDDIHPTIIIKGYRLASVKAKQLFTEISDDISITDKAMLGQIALTSMTGKSAESAEELAELVVNAVTQIATKDDGKTVIEMDDIKVEKKVGGAMNTSELIQGIVVDKEVVHSGMPKKITDAKIALIDAAMEIKSPETDTKVRISDPDQLQAFLDQEEAILRKMVDTVKNAGANVVICQKGIDDIAQHYLAKEGIMAIRRVKKSDMDALAKATGAKIASRVKDLSASDLGKAALVHEKKVAGDNMVFIEGCKNPKSVSLLVRGGTEHVVDEAERAVKDAIGAVVSAINDGKVVSGGGSAEAEVALRLREYAKTIGGREQLAIEAFSEALEIIPRTLAETAGMDSIDTLVALRSKHSNKDGKYFGVNVFTAKLEDMKKNKVLEPLKVKTQALTSGSECAEMLLRIDDIIAGSGKSRMPPGGPPGMGGGMGDMDM